ncbi:MAG TPA: HAMP domain-containing sensor histidine kinase [Polyangiaceae bacterium]
MSRRTLTRALGVPLVPLAPIVVIVVATAVAAAIGLLGIAHLSRASDDDAAARAHLLVETLGARLSLVPAGDRLAAVQLAARRTGAEVLVADTQGRPELDATLGPPAPDALVAFAKNREGETTTRMGAVRFATRAVGDSELYVFVRVPPAEGVPGLLSALLALTTLLVSVAAIVAFAVARDAEKDVVYVARRVLAMAKVRSEPAGEPVALRSMDEVGVLTGAFNALVARFAAAESDYHRNLRRTTAADRDRAQFLAAVSHELRTPLNAVLGFADVLMKGVDGPLTEEQAEEVQQIRDSGSHLNDLIEDILDLSAIESGQLKLHPANIDLRAIAQDVVRELSVLAAKSQLVLRLENGPEVSVWADKRRVRQIVSNVVGNAVKFTQVGEVVVRVTAHGAYGEVSVRDTGPGIRESERQIVFEEYRQAHSERTRHRGTGLGLAIARRLAAMQGGAIELESEVGHGSTFTLRLPRGGAS